jgi:hypothetical protein
MQKQSEDLASFVTLRGRPDAKRSAQIAAVVDAYNLLHNSVSRFLLMLTDSLGDSMRAEPDTSETLDKLLTSLHEHAIAAEFGRMDELAEVMAQARPAGELRNVVFAVEVGGAELDASTELLERLDRAFVRLCVEHVMEEHARAEAIKADVD